MTQKFISRQTRLPRQRAKSPFSPHPFAPVVQAKVQDDTNAAPLVEHSSKNSNVLSRLIHSEPVSESQQTESEVGIKSPKNPRKIQRKRQDSLNQLSALPPTPPSAPHFPIQAKLTVGAAGDECEQEGDRVARQVVNRIQAPQVNLQSSQSNLVQQKISSQGVGRESGDLSGDWKSKLSQARNGEKPLSASLREPMEGEFEADFSGALASGTPNVTKISTDRVDGSKIARFATENNEEELSCNPDSYLEKIGDEIKNTINKIDQLISAHETIKEVIKKFKKARGLAKLSSMEIARGTAKKLSGMNPAIAAIDATISATVGLSKGIAYLTWSAAYPERVDELMESFDDVPTDLLGIIFAPSKSITLTRDLGNAVKIVRTSLENLKKAKNIQETFKSLYELRQAVKVTIDIANQISEIDIVKKFVQENLQPALQQINKAIAVMLEYNPSLDSSTKNENDKNDAPYSPFQSVVESIKGSSLGQYVE